MHFYKKSKGREALNMTEKEGAGLCLFHTVDWLIDKKVSDGMSDSKIKGIYA